MPEARVSQRPAGGLSASANSEQRKLVGALLGLATAEAAAVPLPLASLIRDRLITALAHGWQEADWASFARLAAEQAGLSRKQKAEGSRQNAEGRTH